MHVQVFHSKARQEAREIGWEGKAGLYSYVPMPDQIDSQRPNVHEFRQQNDPNDKTQRESNEETAVCQVRYLRATPVPNTKWSRVGGKTRIYFFIHKKTVLLGKQNLVSTQGRTEHSKMVFWWYSSISVMKSDLVPLTGPFAEMAEHSVKYSSWSQLQDRWTLRQTKMNNKC